MDRTLELQNLLDTGQYFKMICGAGNEDTEEVRRLAMIYTLAGAKGLDISTTPSVVLAAVDGINRAYEIADKLNIEYRTYKFHNIIDKWTNFLWINDKNNILTTLNNFIKNNK